MPIGLARAALPGHLLSGIPVARGFTGALRARFAGTGRAQGPARGGVCCSIKEGNIRGLLAFKEMLSCLRVLSDASRFRIVHELAARGEMQVSDLALLVKVSQPLLSWHLRKLRRAGLVSTRKDGRQVFCSLNRTQIRQCEIMLAELASADLCEGN